MLSTFDQIEIIGTYPYINRRRTDLFSLDMALSNQGNLGAPMRGIYEIYGYPNAGKSTLSYFLAGKLSPQSQIAVCDLELLDTDYLKKAVGMSGFKGKIRIMDLTDPKGKYHSHEDVMTQMVRSLESDSGVAILDSVGAIQPIAEAAGDFGEAFVGKRAKLVAQVSRALSGALRLKDEEGAAIVINHTHQIIGGRGHTTAGGETLKYLASVRLMIWTQEIIMDTAEEKPIGFVVAGQVEKLRYGGRNRRFNYYIVPNLGVHPGVSAMFDCFELGLAAREKTVKLEGKSMGYLKKDLLEYAMSGKNRKFEPFQEALAKYESELKFDVETKDDKPKRRSGEQVESVDGEAEDPNGDVD